MFVNKIADQALTSQTLISTELTEISEALKKANQIYYFAMTLFISSIIVCTICTRLKNVSLIVQLPCFFSFPITALFFLYATRQTMKYEFPPAVVTFTNVNK